MFRKENYNKIIANAEANIKFVGLLGFFGFTAYYFVWHDIFPQYYENMTLRLINSAMFLPYIFYDRFDNKFRKLFPLYFCVTLMICLPYSFSFMLLKNHFSAVWTMSVVAQTYLLIILVSDWKAFLVMTLIGVSGACITVILTDGIIIANHFKAEYLPIFGFTLASGIISIYKKDEDSRHKISMMKSIAGSIAHEVRNPLNSISLIRSQIEFLMSKMKFSVNDENRDDTQKELIELTYKISNSIKRANDIINITLNDLRGQKNKIESFTCLVASEIIENAIKEYGYESELEKSKIVNLITKSDDFYFRGDETMMIYIIFNLIKNSIYYLKSCPDLVVTISSKAGSSKNYIYFHDNGPGMKPEVVNKIFGNFATFDKESGTGLGLAFCKRSMIAMGGDITCESEVDKYTKFILSFPKISSAEQSALSSNKSVSQTFFNDSFEKRVLLVDDSKSNLLIQKKILQKNLGVFCDIVENGQDGLNFLKNSKASPSLIIMDLEMPVMSGFKAIPEIRKINPAIPIIVYSSLSNKLEEVMSLGASEYLVKPQQHEILSKVVSKWLNIKYDPLENKTREEIVSLIKGKKIIIADDESVNLMMLAKCIENCGANVTKVCNGKELLIKCLSKKNYDLIITDINMPIMNGLESVRQIREYEREKNLTFTPVIAFTGDDEKTKIQQLTKYGVNDYFIKGDYTDSLIRTIAFWVSR